MKNYEKLPLPTITEREYHLLSYIKNAESFNGDSAFEIIKNILHAYDEKEKEE